MKRKRVREMGPPMTFRTAPAACSVWRHTTSEPNPTSRGAVAALLSTMKTHRRRTAGFTLVEIMIVVAIIALLASIAVPNFLRARKRAQATRMLEDLRVIDSALDQYAIENNKAGGTAVNWTDLKSYFKTGSVLYNSGGYDLFGVAYVGFSVDSIPKVSSSTFNKLSDVAPASFWSPFY